MDLLYIHNSLIFRSGRRKLCKKLKKSLKKVGVLGEEDRIEGVYVEMGLDDPLEELHKVEQGDEDQIVHIHSMELYSAIESFQKPEVRVETRYKTVDRKVKPVAQPLPSDSDQQVRWL